MSEIESKIADLVLGFEHCEDNTYYPPCAWVYGHDKGDSRCGQCVVDRILALIAADRAGLVEALERIKVDTTLDYYEIREIAQEALAEIDSALKEMGK
jgi:hypothetical protein